MAEENNDNLSENTISETVNEHKSSTENLRVLENIDVALTVEVGGAEIKIKELENTQKYKGKMFLFEFLHNRL